MLQIQIKSDFTDIEKIYDLVKSAIESEIKNLQRSLTKTNKLLTKFEEKYKISSEYFLNHYTAEDMEGGDEEYINWLGEIRIKQTLTDSLEKLQAIEYVTQ